MVIDGTANMKICIYGAGAVGGTIGGVLTEQKQEVSLIARGIHLEALKTRGCTVETGGRSFTVHLECSENPEDLGIQDCVFITVKAPAMSDVANDIAPLIGPDTLVVTAMNGIPWWFFKDFPEGGPAISLPALDPDGLVSRKIPAERVIGCVVHLGATVPEPGIIRHVADNRLIMGEATGGMSNRLKGIVGLFDPTPLNASATNNLRQEIWVKLLGNFNFAPISSLTDASNGEIGADPALRKLAADMFEEAAAAGSRIGLDPGMTADQRTDLGASMGDFRTSMLQDFERSRSPEIDAIVGAVVEIGRVTGIPMPLSEGILALVTQKARELGLY